MKRFKLITLYISMVLSISVLGVFSSVCAREGENGMFRIGGLAFGDFYHVLSHHSPEGDGATGMVLRRGYLTLNADISSDWYGRLRFEMNQSGEFETYRFEVDFKDIYLGWKSNQHRILFGLAPTPTFDLIESVWGLRYLARTPLDLQGVASRDVGISAAGVLCESADLSYRLMGGAGLEFGNESGDGHKWMGALTWDPDSPWIVDIYLDYEVLSGAHDRATFQLFAAYKTESLRWGIQYSHQDRQEDPRLQLASAFAVMAVSESMALIGRIDRIFEPSPKGDNISYLPFDPTAPATFLIGGLEFYLTEHLYVTPNMTFTFYDRNDQGVIPETDIHLRATLYIDFEKN